MVSREWGARLERQASLRLTCPGLRPGPTRLWDTAYEGVESFYPEHLAGEDHAEVAGDGFGDGVQVKLLAEFLLHRGYRLGGDAAGDDQVEIAEIGIHVEGEAVRSDEAGDVDADGGELGFGVRRSVRSPLNSRSPRLRDDSSNRSLPLGMTIFLRLPGTARASGPSRHRSGLELSCWGWRSRRRCGLGLLRGGGRIRLRLTSFVYRRGSHERGGRRWDSRRSVRGRGR